MPNQSALKTALLSPTGRTIATFAAVATLVGFVPHRERGLLEFGAGGPQANAAELLPSTAFASLDTPTTISRLRALVGGPPAGGVRRERFAPPSGARSIANPGPVGIPQLPSIIPLGGGTSSAAPDPGGLPPTGGGGPGATGIPPGGGLPGGKTGGGGSFAPPPTTVTPEPPTPGTPVPEPGVWAMMILGISLVGGALRRRGGMALSRRVRAGSILPR